MDDVFRRKNRGHSKTVVLELGHLVLDIMSQPNRFQSLL